MGIGDLDGPGESLVRAMEPTVDASSHDSRSGGRLPVGRLSLAPISLESSFFPLLTFFCFPVYFALLWMDACCGFHAEGRLPCCSAPALLDTPCSTPL
jgi:hypothetical protein